MSRLSPSWTPTSLAPLRQLGCALQGERTRGPLRCWTPSLRPVPTWPRYRRCRYPPRARPAGPRRWPRKGQRRSRPPLAPTRRRSAVRAPHPIAPRTHVAVRTPPRIATRPRAALESGACSWPPRSLRVSSRPASAFSRIPARPDRPSRASSSSRSAVTRSAPWTSMIWPIPHGGLRACASSPPPPGAHRSSGVGASSWTDAREPSWCWAPAPWAGCDSSSSTRIAAGRTLLAHVVSG